MPSMDENTDILQWGLEPGDAIAFHFLTLHAAEGNSHMEHRRRAYSIRLLGDDMVHAPRAWKTSPHFPGLQKELKAGTKCSSMRARDVAMPFVFGTMPPSSAVVGKDTNCAACAHSPDTQEHQWTIDSFPSCGQALDRTSTTSSSSKISLIGCSAEKSMAYRNRVYLQVCVCVLAMATHRKRSQDGNGRVAQTDTKTTVPR
eukprot:m.246249 g.246249  ORF g.246249 m.246249 type:complete len:201 (+) comp19489_c0_seq7:1396-1998(+)